jgi:hypothetical protein
MIQELYIFSSNFTRFTFKTENFFFIIIINDNEKKKKRKKKRKEIDTMYIFECIVSRLW